MNISRKEFFRKSLLSLGDAVFSVKDALHGDADHAVPFSEADEPVAVANNDLQATARNESCLAKNCGCFSCVERCAVQAIMLLPGVGISIDESLCTGCGSCEYVCPVHPKAIQLIPRKNI